MGDIDRYRWRSYLPEKNERLKVVSDVGSLPPVTVNSSKIKVLNEAWGLLFTTLREMTAKQPIEVSRNGASHQARKKVWDDIQKEMFERFTDMKEEYVDQQATLRSQGWAS